MSKQSFIFSFICTFVIALVFLSIPLNSASANEAAHITADNLNVRSTPSLQGQILGKLHTGDQVQVIEHAGEWLKITSKLGKGYVHSLYVKIDPSKTTVTSPAKSSTATAPVKVIVNGEQLKLPVDPPIIDNRVLIPFRGIGETLGIKVSWLPETRQVEAISSDKKVLFTIGATTVQVNDETVSLTPAPTIVENSTVIPLRFFAESYGASVSWDQKERVVLIDTVDESLIIDDPILSSPNPETPKIPDKIITTVLALIEEDDVRVYEEPSKKSDRLGKLEEGDTVKIYEYPQADDFDDEWLEIDFDDEIGYIDADSIRPLDETIKATVTATVLNIRESPDTESDIVAKLIKNQVVLVYELDGNWAKIKYDDEWGYIHTAYLKMQKGNQTYAVLIEPVLEEDDDRSFLQWGFLGAVTTSHRIFANGVEIETSASNIEKWDNEDHPAIDRIDYHEASNGSKIRIYFNRGYHFVVRHSTDSVKVILLNNGLEGKRIVVDPGHGDHDPGAIGATGLREKEVNIDVGHKLAALLRGAGADVILTRQDDTFLSLQERVEVAHDNEADVFISLHADSFKASSKGSTTFYHSGKNPSWQQSKLLSDIAIEKLTSQLGTENRGSNDKSLHVIRETEIPAILVELAFLSNPSEEKLLKSDEFRQKAAQALFDTFVEFYE
ncbi:N-acetylmuramoyl-L-alanine amidase [Calidifontibacillus oryziterrae]|uniref:N-acetylmuramoyl-L-alanine amidase n=1 Tax=Calidifontibacillus oryziterrae TaxID=1191699 RepID=UPI0002E1DF77|nr:N-acetylmuramoyl-L-alanine amidase [Calidifontibacillus oryziterrae]